MPYLRVSTDVQLPLPQIVMIRILFVLLSLVVIHAVAAEPWYRQFCKDTDSGSWYHRQFCHDSLQQVICKDVEHSSWFYRQFCQDRWQQFWTSAGERVQASIELANAKMELERRKVAEQHHQEMLATDNIANLWNRLWR